MLLMNNRRRKQQARLAVCLLFLCLCSVLSSCRSQGGGADAAGDLDVWFFACSEDADSILLQTEDVNVMIDTGTEEDSDALLQKLSALSVDEIDLLILTHPDKDHIGGAAALLNAYPVGEVMQTSCQKGSKLQEELDRILEEEEVSVPDTVREIAFGALSLTVYPPEEQEYDGSNNYSIAVLAEYDGRRFFFAGDAKKKRIEELLDEDLPFVDVYKAAHHGRDNGKSGDLIRKLQPEFAVVTAAAAEEKTAAAFAQAGTTVYSTYGRDVHVTVTDGILDVQ